EQIAAGDEQPDPEHRPRHTEREESQVAHTSHTGDEGRKRTYDRNEPRDDYGLSAMTRVEGFRALERPTVEAPPLPRCDVLTEQTADPVVAIVAAERGGDESDLEQLDPHVRRCPDRARSEQQRVSGEERRHDESGLAEDDQKQDEIGPQPEVL